MTDVGVPLLDRWANFYVIVGSSAAALTGLQFVVMALISEARPNSSRTEVNTYGTPTIVHFCSALLVSAIVSAPWPNLPLVAVTLFLVGAWGIGYGVVVLARALRPISYQPVMEDWLWYSGLPIAANIGLVAGSAILLSHPIGALFTIAAAALMLLLIGIHNSWDTVTFIVTTKPGEQPK